MKKIKISMLGLMFLLAAVMMTGCRNRDNMNTTQPVSPSAGTSSMQESTSMEENTSGNEGDGSWAEESTGVLDGLMDDVEPAPAVLWEQTRAPDKRNERGRAVPIKYCLAFLVP